MKSGILRAATALTAAVLLTVAGCNSEIPATTDPTKAPWLDPQAQLEGLKNQDYKIRGLSAFHLGNMGARASDAVPELDRLAKEDANAKVRDNAREALEKIRAATGTPTP